MFKKSLLAVAVLATVSSPAWATVEVGPGETMTWSVALADENGQPCDTNLWRVWLLRAESPTAGIGAMTPIINLPSPSPTGFDENGQPYTVTFAGVSSDGMVEGVVYYFFAVLEDMTAMRSVPNLPSEDTILEGTPPSAVGTAVYRVTVEVVIPVPPGE